MPLATVVNPQHPLVLMGYLVIGVTPLGAVYQIVNTTEAANELIRNLNQISGHEVSWTVEPTDLTEVRLAKQPKGNHGEKT
jgi:hypothetical protein